VHVAGRSIKSSRDIEKWSVRILDLTDVSLNVHPNKNPQDQQIYREEKNHDEISSKHQRSSLPCGRRCNRFVELRQAVIHAREPLVEIKPIARRPDNWGDEIPVTEQSCLCVTSSASFATSTRKRAATGASTLFAARIMENVRVTNRTRHCSQILVQPGIPIHANFFPIAGSPVSSAYNHRRST